MATDFTITLGNRPGTLAQLGETLGKAGINIDGGCGIPFAGEGNVHLLFEDAGAARKALESAGIKVTDERPVLVTDVADRPGELGRLARKIADAGVNIELFYLNREGQLVLAADNLEKARQAIS